MGHASYKLLSLTQVGMSKREKRTAHERHRGSADTVGPRLGGGHTVDCRLVAILFPALPSLPRSVAARPRPLTTRCTLAAFGMGEGREDCGCRRSRHRHRMRPSAGATGKEGRGRRE